MSRCSLLSLVSLVSLLPCVQGAEQQAIILRNATIHDGSGKPGQKGALLVRGERIEAIGEDIAEGGALVLDCTGLVIAPGFIDLHTHCDYPLQDPATRSNLNYLMQGVTTVVTGNCGSGPHNVAAYFKSLRDNGIGTNAIHLVPHNNVRAAVMGNANRPPTTAELQKMQDLVDQGMKDGAWGMATGLIYNPGTYAKTDEIIALAKVASKHGGIYASHIRNEGVNLLVGTDEAITIGREAKLPVHISHMKASGERAWGKAGDQISMVQKARRSGQVVTADQYPYIASSTSLSATLIPARYREGTRQQQLARFDDAEVGPKLRRAIEDALKERRGGATVRIASYRASPEWQGKPLDVIAKQAKKEAVDIVIEIERHGGAGVVNFGMSEEDVRLIMKQDFVATASDGSGHLPGPAVPHPRNYGTFPRKIGRYAIEEGVISLEQAIRSASGLPADILQLKERGYLRKGFIADIVVFDPKSYRDTATFDRPHQYASIVHLFVNGQQVVRDGRYSGVLAGKPLLRQEHGRR